MSERADPAALWIKAEGDPERYRALMVEHGHLVPKKPGDSNTLPCGYRPSR